jgi:hypothetical protein
MTSYASTYAEDAKNNPELQKQQHDARKKAIEALIDATTDRRTREGDWVYSIGVNVGFGFPSWQWTRVTDPNDPRYTRFPARPTFNLPPQLELPIGFAIQKLPGRRHMGFHVQFSGLDLAQFVAYAYRRDTGQTNGDTTNSSAVDLTRPVWANFVTANLQVGWILGTPSNNFMLGFEGRWAPTLFATTATTAGRQDERRGGLWRIGFFFSYYVPFFDFN